jgi:uncharacterized protein YeaO (DUF488 family)
MIQTKRVYDAEEKSDGARFLVDHLWPRGIRKDALHFESWLKEVGPSDELRKWFHHDADKWKEFQRRYFAELNQKPENLQPILDAAKQGDVTLLFSSRETEHNNAVALKTYLEKKLRSRKSKAKS